MVNLLGRRGGSSEAPRFDAAESARIEVRLGTLLSLAFDDRLRGIARAAEELGAELEELDATPTRIAAEGILASLDGFRREACAAADGGAPAVQGSAADRMRLAAGDFVCHRPGRSLGTGEAEIASRGYFDVWDRPPLVGWVGVLPATPASVGDGVWIVAWVGPEALEQAWAGCRACPNGALARLDDVSAPAARELRAAVRAVARAALR